MPKNEPRYLKIYHDLQQQIANGQLQPDEQLPTELQLAKTYAVSRITSKRALTELESHGLIYRQQGSGSFVQRLPQTQTAQQLLLVLPFPTDAGLGDYASGVSQAATARGYQTVTMDTENFNQLSLRDLQTQYAGIIYLTQNLYADAERLYQLKLAHLPIVLLDKQFPELGLPVVAADNFTGGQLATEHLIQLQHTQILFYAQAESVLPSSVYDRYFGYLTALHAAKLTPPAPLAQLADLNQFTPEQWVRYLKDHAITSIVVENDLTAIKLMNALRDTDPALFQRLSIVGFDNIQAASLTYPALTTVAQDFQGMGAKAVDRLLQPTTTNMLIKLPVTLIPRDSTKPMVPYSKED
ncbi:GntR family transcriptional regulator [Lactiplantibacillus songbeiensis]|uniref:GntR family transcriptional regulator n=1 Tax=Lactiplantibacillus songbeiensis TaxID=2559920 RepID=A0ABW4BZJ3_9LACO|nr:LacI family DNA-binding transcriptional regulator [Lactiplantibacillus songbeiensis]